MTAAPTLAEQLAAARVKARALAQLAAWWVRSKMAAK